MVLILLVFVEGSRIALWFLRNVGGGPVGCSSRFLAFPLGCSPVLLFAFGAAGGPRLFCRPKDILGRNEALVALSLFSPSFLLSPLLLILLINYLPFLIFITISLPHLPFLLVFLPSPLLFPPTSLLRFLFLSLSRCSHQSHAPRLSYPPPFPIP